MNECIITQKFDCPHKVIEGKICTYCKIPDSHTLVILYTDGLKSGKNLFVLDQSSSSSTRDKYKRNTS